ncbi:MAG: DUF6599 family protein [Planctomycetota bacterium]|jgi:hypothetical protein
MGSVPHRARRLESAVSICILLVLCLIGFGVFIKQFDSDIGRFGLETASSGLATETQISEKEKTSLDSLVPSGYKMLSEAEFYDAETLYEKINGKAPFYTESGFVELSTQRFVNINDDSLVMELYVFDMSEVKNAFSVYSVQKRAEGKPLQGMQFGYKTSNGIYLAHGNYYAEMVGYSESDQLLKAMEEVAGSISANFTVDEDTEIAELALFDKEGLVEGSFRLYLANAFGFEGLSNTFAARYDVDGQNITAFLSRFSNQQDAKTVSESYYKFLIDNGATAKEPVNKILEGKIVDFYGSTEIVSMAGAFVVGIHEADEQRPAEKLAVKLIDKLGQIKSD